MKVITNQAKINVLTNKLEDGQEDATFGAIIAHSDVVNDNGYFLVGNAIRFDREKYPLHYAHNDSTLDELVGYAKPKYNEITKAYEAELVIYESEKKLKQAILDGVFDSVSIGYYVESYSWETNDVGEYYLNITEAQMKEVSIVSVGADPEAKLINAVSDEFSRELEALKQNHLKLSKIKEKYQ